MKGKIHIGCVCKMMSEKSNTLFAFGIQPEDQGEVRSEGG